MKEGVQEHLFECFVASDALNQATAHLKAELGNFDLPDSDWRLLAANVRLSTIASAGGRGRVAMAVVQMSLDDLPAEGSVGDKLGLKMIRYIDAGQKHAIVLALRRIWEEVHSPIYVNLNDIELPELCVLPGDVVAHRDDLQVLYGEAMELAYYFAAAVSQ